MLNTILENQLVSVLIAAAVTLPAVLVLMFAAEFAKGLWERVGRSAPRVLSGLFRNTALGWSEFIELLLVVRIVRGFWALVMICAAGVCWWRGWLSAAWVFGILAGVTYLVFSWLLVRREKRILLAVAQAGSEFASTAVCPPSRMDRAS